jgi:hypothetical protein
LLLAASCIKHHVFFYVASTTAASTTATNPGNINLVVYSVTIVRAGRDVAEQDIRKTSKLFDEHEDCVSYFFWFGKGGSITTQAYARHGGDEVYITENYGKLNQKRA